MAEDWRTHLPTAPVVGDVPATESGFINAIDGEALGLVVVALGGGRKVETDRINPAVGISDMRGVGKQVGRGDALCTIHAASEEAAEEAALAIRSAVVIGDKPADRPLVLQRIDP